MATLSRSNLSRGWVAGSARSGGRVFLGGLVVGRLTIGALATVLASCGSEGDALSAPGGEAAAVEAWRLSDIPDFLVPGFEIGGDSIFLGGGFPITTFMPDGSIAVAINARNDYRVVFADTLGRALAAFGGFGQGPGEFRRITGLTLKGDTVAAWDWINGRVTLFAGLERVGQFPLIISRSQTYVGLLGSGAVVVTSQADRIPDVIVLPEDWIDEGEPRPYHLIDRRGDSVATLLGAPEPPPSSFRLTGPGGSQPRMSYVGLQGHCLPLTRHATTGDGLLIADNRRGVLLSLDRAGSLTPLYATAHRDTVRQEIVDLLDQHLVARGRTSGDYTPESKQQVRDALGPAGAPLPAVWSEMVPDADGGVWLQRASCHATWLGDPTNTWEVVGPDWRLERTVTVPREMRILAVDGDRVLAFRPGDFDEPLLGLYRLVR